MKKKKEDGKYGWGKGNSGRGKSKFPKGMGTPSSDAHSDSQQPISEIKLNAEEVRPQKKARK